MQRVPKKPPLSSINRSVPILSHSLSYAVKARFTMARANQSRERKRERRATNLVRSVLQIHFARDEEFEAWAQAQRYRSTNAQQGNFAPVSLHCCYVVSYLQVQLHNLYLLYPPSPLGCGLVYNWRICKHIRATDSAP